MRLWILALALLVLGMAACDAQACHRRSGERFRVRATVTTTKVVQEVRTRAVLSAGCADGRCGARGIRLLPWR